MNQGQYEEYMLAIQKHFLENGFFLPKWFLETCMRIRWSCIKNKKLLIRHLNIVRRARIKRRHKINKVIAKLMKRGMNAR